MGTLVAPPDGLREAGFLGCNKYTVMRRDGNTLTTKSLDVPNLPNAVEYGVAPVVWNCIHVYAYVSIIGVDSTPLVAMHRSRVLGYIHTLLSSETHWTITKNLLPSPP